MVLALTIVLYLLLAGSLGFCILVVIAARNFLKVRRPPVPAVLPPITIMKPMAGMDEGLEENLRRHFEQDYPEFEILFATESPDSPTVALLEQVRAQYPHIPSRILFVGEAQYPNPKTFKLGCMVPEARYDLFVMTDSDMRPERDLLRIVAAEFSDPKVGVATCLFRGVPGSSLSAKLSAVMMNTEFLAGALAARQVEGVKFALGPAMVARRSVVADIGGWEGMRDYCAEDFLLGNWAAARGHGVILSSAILEHRIGTFYFKKSSAQRIRWGRSTRRSRPAGYIGQLFTFPLPILTLLMPLHWWWPAIALTVALRAAAAYATAGWILRDPLTLRQWWLVPMQDFLSFAYWILGFFGKIVYWRGDAYELTPDGKYTLVKKASS
jgi:ceramide glucosyltransferase